MNARFLFSGTDDEFNLIIKDTLQSFRAEFNAEIDLLRKRTIKEETHYDNSVKRLFSHELNSLKENDLDSFANEIIEIILAVHFNPDERIKGRLKELGFTNTCLRWLIPLDEIIPELKKINTSSEVLIRGKDLKKLLRIHFQYKIINAVLLDLGKVAVKRSGSIYNEAHNFYVDYFKRRMYAKKVGKGSLSSVDIHLALILIDILKNHPEIKESNLNYDTLVSLQGKTEKNTLSEIVEHLVVWTGSERNLYNVLFDFFKLILPDAPLLSEDEFLSAKNPTYEAKYETYRYTVLKKLLHSSSDKSIF
jgi:hypothetical protein